MSERDEIVRWAAHVDWLIIIVAAVLALALSGCASYSEPVADARSIDQLAEQSGWKRADVPATCVCFKQGDPALACKVPVAGGCAERYGSVALITTRRPWVDEPVGLIAHELAHAAGRKHQ